MVWSVVGMSEKFSGGMNEHSESYAAGAEDAEENGHR